MIRSDKQFFSFSLIRRPAFVGGWLLTLMLNGQVKGGGVFSDDEYQDALQQGEDFCVRCADKIDGDADQVAYMNGAIANERDAMVL
jgi:hypothetical protein